jgi:hypothetical protein
MENNKICQWLMENEGEVCGNTCMGEEEYCPHHVEEGKEFIKGLLRVYISGNVDETKRLNKEVKGWKKITEQSVGLSKYKLNQYIKNKQEVNIDNESIVNSLI